MKRQDKNGLTRAKAHYLFHLAMVGGTYLVKDKDGSCWIVDHGAGEVAKEGDHWIDTEGPDWQENSFMESKYDFDIVSWEDPEPLDIYDYLKENGWLKSPHDFAD